MEDILRELFITSWLEALAFVLSLLYLILATAKIRLCWIAGGIGSAIYIYLFVGAKFYMDAWLNAYYVAMAVYGWRVWSGNEDEEIVFKVTFLKLWQHLFAIICLGVLVLGCGFYLDGWTEAEMPYLDSFTTLFALFATFLTARRVYENWFYWLVVDAVAAWMYWQKGLMWTCLLMIIYEFLILYGIYSWWRAHKAEKN
ncbi:MAG: nicotinamide mononucleotide transporter [Opitutales bacterium]|nr:nicotinamide mononucleotide transporter [Opitutales bacterium]